MSRPSGCPACWPDADVRWLVEDTRRRIVSATAELWPQFRVDIGPLFTAGTTFASRVQVGGSVVCAAVRPGGALSRVVRGDHGDLAAVRSDDRGCADQVQAQAQAEQLTALAAHSGLRVAAPTALTGGVLFTPWAAGPSLAARVQAQPAMLTELLATLMDDLSELHRDPARQLRQVAAPAQARSLPRVVTAALEHTTDHFHADRAPAGEVGELRALAGSLSMRLGRLAARWDPTACPSAGLAFGNLSPGHMLYPDGSPAPMLVAPSLGPEGEPADTGTLLGHLHLLAVGAAPSVRADLVEGLEAWLAGQLAARREQWKGWLSAVLTVWAATVFDRVVTAETLPAALPLAPVTAALRTDPLPALAALDVLTCELRRRGTDAALNATLNALAGTTSAGTATDSAELTATATPR
ncbi:hypothetical protein CcI6DRAFT_03346 [Frankia sp. CcI6]|uniref:hypothetical protein n=1 Tax=Frankia TaxID=1854 RepID=UPI0003CFADD5|nr:MULTISPECIES: hypothetical protein [Frankia]ETA01223.1 hypothetical protein CcI6DRAFT_03346 [Frankia sp. CcI6]KFB04668.1 hypothetical protein ALLO2DRAFT_02598 [Frankia sp. Allo2]OAA22592.1 hypothetical protein AAY23_106232 [Frankia casuarinae]OHV52810.1 hypothetical protein CgIS1_16175 [Frankia sp. CgIS1]